MRRLPVLLAGAMLLAGPALAYQPPLVAFAFQDARIVESSGLARSPQDFTVVWTHNDGGDPTLFAVDFDGDTVATLTLDGVTVVDWEDMAAGPSPVDGSPSLFIGDVGDNVEDGRSRDTLQLHVVPEPNLRDEFGKSLTATPVTWELTWGDDWHDVETLMVTPDGMTAILVTKDVTGTSTIATADLSGDPAELVALEVVGTVSLLRPAPPNPVPGGPISAIGFGTATGGDISKDGELVALRTYEDLLEWDVVGGDVVGALSTEPRRLDLPDAPQGEALAYASAGSIFVSSEGVGMDVHVLLPDVGVEEVITTTPIDDDTDDGGVDTALIIAIAAPAVLLLAWLLGRRRRA